MYYILAYYYYYLGTYGAPKDGPLCDEGQRLYFQTKEEAGAYLVSLDCYNLSGSKWTFDPDKSIFGAYMCDHGEYAAPLYWVRKVRGT